MNKTMIAAGVASVLAVVSVNAMADLSEGLIAHYPFDGNANDASGNGNDGTVNGATLTEDRNGNQNGAYHFDGSNYIDIPEVKGLTSQVISGFSMSAWIKMSGGTQVIENNFSDGEVWIEGDPSIMGFAAGGVARGDADFSVWTHVIGTYDGSKNRFYVNGKLSSEADSDVSSFTMNDSSFKIGRDDEADVQYFVGDIDDVRIYDRALSEAEIQQLYNENGGSGGEMQYALGVRKTGNGTITSAPDGINCGTTCDSNFTENAPVTLTATPDANYTFTGWSGDCTNSSGVCKLVMDGDKNVLAVFKPSGYTLTVSKVGNGTITSTDGKINCGSDCNEKYAGGTSVTLIPTAADGYAFSKWNSACTTTSADNNCAVVMKSNKTVAATFKTSSADFAITDITVSPANPNSGNLFSAVITVKNQGSSAADGGYLDVWANQSTPQTCYAEGSEWIAVGTLKAGASKTYAVALRAGAAGNKTVRAFVDSWCEVTESKDDNNQFTKNYTVK